MQNNDWRPGATLDILKLRARVLQNTRAFFLARGVLEVETPIVSAACSSDRHIQSLRSKLKGQPAFLHTSPEFAMKRLLACYGEPIYQVCKVFRDDELGPLHNPEFSMLEWYRPGFDMFALMDEVQALVASFYDQQAPGFSRISYREAFERTAGFNPHAVNAAECRQCAQAHNIECPVGLGDEVDEWLDWLLTQLVLPALSPTAYTFIYEYPASQCALAKLAVNAQGDTVAQRFELLYGELELANGYFELQDVSEQRRRFDADNAARRESGLTPAVNDTHLLAALEHGLPECSGVALGLDRLLMVLSDSHQIHDVLSFSWRNA
jgi:lysyl-tRNA synthetase class 2